MDSEMNEFNGKTLQTVKVYDEDEEVEVKYEPFDSELIPESEILGYDSGCLTCRKVIKKITAHLTDHVGFSSNDVDGLTEPPEYIVDPNYIIKIEPEDDDIMNDTPRPGSHDSSNSGQRQWKVLDFDTGQCSPDCEICKKYLRELREHLGINHPQLQFQSGCAPAPLPKRSTVYGPLKTLEYKIPEHPYLRQFGRYVDGKKVLKVVLTPEMEEKNRKRKTRTSKRAGYLEEAIAVQLSSSRPVKKKSRPDSDQSDQKNNVIERRTRRGENSDSESKSKESESKERSVNEIQTEVESSELNPTSAVTFGGSSETHEINLTDHMSHTRGNQDITQTRDNFTEVTNTTVGRKSVKRFHGGGEPKMHHAEEEPTNLTQIIIEPAKTVDTAGELPKLTHTGDKPSMTKRIVENPESLPRSVGRRKSANILEHHILKTSESKSNSTTPLNNSHSYNCKKCRKIFSTGNNLWYRNYVVYGDKRFDCSECGQSFMSRNALTLHMKIHMLRNNLLVENGENKLREQMSHTGGNSATSYASEEPLTKTLRIGKPTNSIRIDHEVGKETQISNSGGESNAPAHIGTDPGPVTTIGAKSENVDSITVASGKSTNMAPGEGKLVSMSHAAQELANMTHVRDVLENTTSTVVKSPDLIVTGRKLGVIVHTGGKSTNMNRVGGRSRNMFRTAGKLDEIGHTAERPEKLVCITGKPGKTDQNVRSAELTTHTVIEIGSEEEEGPFNCDICEKSFDRSDGLTLHMLDHIEYRCDECSINFSSSERLSYHKTHHELGTLHKCGDCGKGFESLNWLKTHERIHMQNYPLKCDECYIRVQTQSDFISHMLTHGGKKLLRCDVCGMRFKFLSKLITHVITHGGEKPFRCETCEERFKTLAELDTHIVSVIHSEGNYNFYSCGTCRMFFYKKAQLTDHKVMHSEKPFKCYICKESFKTLDRLTRHIGIHREWKPYNCEVCEKSFRRSDKLIRHTVKRGH